MTSVIDSLQQQIASCEGTLRDLRQQLAEAQHNQRQQEKVLRQKTPLVIDPLDHDMNFGVPDDFRSEVFAVLEQEHAAQDAASKVPMKNRWPLEQHEYKRYGRQLIMPEIGLQGECNHQAMCHRSICTDERSSRSTAP
jgi:adenylyltransferase/sulfurtransferase